MRDHMRDGVFLQGHGAMAGVFGGRWLLYLARKHCWNVARWFKKDSEKRHLCLKRDMSVHIETSLLSLSSHISTMLHCWNVARWFRFVCCLKLPSRVRRTNVFEGSWYACVFSFWNLVMWLVGKFLQYLLRVPWKNMFRGRWSRKNKDKYLV